MQENDQKCFYKIRILKVIYHVNKFNMKLLRMSEILPHDDFRREFWPCLPREAMFAHQPMSVFCCDLFVAFA